MRLLVLWDIARDIAAAEANGCRSVAVATGHYDVDELRAAGATVVLPDLPATVAAVSGG